MKSEHPRAWPRPKCGLSTRTECGLTLTHIYNIVPLHHSLVTGRRQFAHRGSPRPRNGVKNVESKAFVAVEKSDVARRTYACAVRGASRTASLNDPLLSATSTEVSSMMIATVSTQRSGTKFLGSLFSTGNQVATFGEMFNPDDDGPLAFRGTFRREQSPRFALRAPTGSLTTFCNVLGQSAEYFILTSCSINLSSAAHHGTVSMHPSCTDIYEVVRRS